jgi:hypothetical protein
MRLVGLVGVILASVMLLTPRAEAADPCVDNGFCSASCLATPCYFDSDEKKPGQGVPVTWLTLPIKYKVNVADLISGQKLDKAKVIAAIQAAFATWEKIPCSTLKFKYEGESTLYTQENGIIKVVFKNDKAWMGSYMVNSNWKTYLKGDMDTGLITLNSTPNHSTYSFNYAIGAKAKAFDIQTMVTFLIPQTVGIEVLKADGQAPIAYNKVEHDLCKGHKDAAVFSYLDKTNTSCKAPTLNFCAGGITPADAGPVGDGGPNPDSGNNPDSGPNPGSDSGVNPGSDGGIINPPEEDDGCCRVSHARSSTSIPFLTVLGLALLLGLTRRRRR